MRTCSLPQGRKGAKENVESENSRSLPYPRDLPGRPLLHILQLDASPCAQALARLLDPLQEPRVVL
jgi:hypothetical protein